MSSQRYEVMRHLATGGMAEIWLARQRGIQGFEKLVVLKRILPHLLQNKDFLQMFVDEGRLAAHLSHPNIVQIFDLGKMNDSLFIAMEFVQGENLRYVQKRITERGQRAMPVPYAAKVISQACEALYYAHTKSDNNGHALNLVHRDLSPANILLSYQGQVKIVDFGIAKAASQIRETRVGMVKGHYGYMSPEQCSSGPLDHRSDIFSLGIVLWELVTGRRLFSHNSDLATVKAICELDAPRPSSIRPNVPAELEAVIMRALEKNASDRFKDCHRMHLALERFLHGQGSPITPVHLARFMKSLFAERLAAWQKVIQTGTGEFDKDTVDSLSYVFNMGTPSRVESELGEVAAPSQTEQAETTRQVEVSPKLLGMLTEEAPAGEKPDGIHVDVVVGEQVVRTLELPAQAVVGSGPNAHLRAAGDPSVVEKHAILHLDGNTIMLTATGGPVDVNGARVDFAVLEGTDVVKAGRFTFRARPATGPGPVAETSVGDATELVSRPKDLEGAITDPGIRSNEPPPTIETPIAPSAQTTAPLSETRIERGRPEAQGAGDGPSASREKAEAERKKAEAARRAAAEAERRREEEAEARAEAAREKEDARRARQAEAARRKEEAAAQKQAEADRRAEAKARKKAATAARQPDSRRAAQSAAMEEAEASHRAAELPAPPNGFEPDIFAEEEESDLPGQRSSFPVATLIGTSEDPAQALHQAQLDAGSPVAEVLHTLDEVVLGAALLSTGKRFLTAHQRKPLAKMGRGGCVVNLPAGTTATIRRGGQGAAEPLAGPTRAQLLPHDRLEVPLDDGLYRIRVFQPALPPPKVRSQLATRLWAICAAVAVLAHVAGFGALVLFQTFDIFYLPVADPDVAERFAEGQLAEVKKPKPKKKKPKPKKKIVKKKEEPKKDPTEAKAKIPKRLRQKLNKRLAKSGGGGAKSIISALKSPVEGEGTTLKEVVSNIDAVKGGGSSSALKISGTLAGLPGGKVNLAKGGGGDVGTLSGTEVAGDAGKLKGRGGSGKVRGKVSSVRALAKVSGQLSREEVLKVINGKLGQIQGCYEKALTSNPGLSGKITFEWTVRTTGRVGSAREKSSTMGNAQVSNCILGVIRTMRFPKPRGGEVVIAYPFMFRSVSS